MSAQRFKKGDTVGPYRIDTHLGSGGVADVYSATHVFTGKPVALKCLQTRFEHDDDMTSRMGREARGLARIDHPNIVTVLDAGIDNEIMWTAMELLTGKTAREFLHIEKRLLPVDTLYFGIETLDALAAAHEHGCIHRDVKPENLFITDQGEIKLLDFGAAKFYGTELSSTNRMNVLGTPHYMSPEHLRGEKVDGRADVYSLTVVLYELATGRYIFGKDGVLPSNREVGQLHLNAPVTTPSALFEDFPPGLEAILMKGLAKNRDERFGSAAEMARAMRTERSALLASGKGSLMPRRRATKQAPEGAHPFRAALAMMKKRDGVGEEREATLEVPAGGGASAPRVRGGTMRMAAEGAMAVSTEPLPGLAAPGLREAATVASLRGPAHGTALSSPTSAALPGVERGVESEGGASDPALGQRDSGDTWSAWLSGRSRYALAALFGIPLGLLTLALRLLVPASEGRAASVDMSMCPCPADACVIASASARGDSDDTVPVAMTPAAAAPMAADPSANAPAPLATMPAASSAPAALPAVSAESEVGAAPAAKAKASAAPAKKTAQPAKSTAKPAATRTKPKAKPRIQPIFGDDIVQ